MMPMNHEHTGPMPASPAGRACPRQERGQAMVEFAAVLLPLVLILVGIIQFGFLFSAYVGVSNAVREAAREGTVYQFNPSMDQSQNDLARCEAMLNAAAASLDTAVPGQFTGSCSSAGGGDDLAITYPDSGTCPATSRSGCQIAVTLTYRQPLFVPLVGMFLSADAENRIGLSARVTMVLN